MDCSIVKHNRVKTGEGGGRGEKARKKWLVSCLTTGYTCACLIVFAHIIHIIYVSDISGDPSNSYKPSDQWQCDNVFYAETIMDRQCMDGVWKDF